MHMGHTGGCPPYLGDVLHARRFAIAVFALTLTLQSTHSDDPRETFFLFQRLPVTIRRFNAVCIANSFGNFEVEVRRNQPRHT